MPAENSGWEGAPGSSRHPMKMAEGGQGTKAQGLPVTPVLPGRQRPSKTTSRWHSPYSPQSPKQLQHRVAACCRRFCTPLWDGLPLGKAVPALSRLHVCISEDALKNKQTWLFLHLHMYKQHVSCKIYVHIFALWLLGRPKQLVVTALEVLRQQLQLPTAFYFVVFWDLPA